MGIGFSRIQGNRAQQGVGQDHTPPSLHDRDRFELRTPQASALQSLGVGGAGAGLTAAGMFAAGSGVAMIPCLVVGAAAALGWALVSYLSNRSRAHLKNVIDEKERLERDIAGASRPTLHRLRHSIASLSGDMEKAGMEVEAQDLDLLALRRMLHLYAPPAVPAAQRGNLSDALETALTAYERCGGHNERRTCLQEFQALKVATATSDREQLSGLLERLDALVTPCARSRLTQTIKNAQIFTLSTLCQRLEEARQAAAPTAAASPGAIRF